MRQLSTEDAVRSEGANFIKVLENTIIKDKDLYYTFLFCASEAGVDTSNESLNEKMFLRLTTKMIHSHGNELIQNRALLSGQTVDAPLMLREELKVLASKAQ